MIKNEPLLKGASTKIVITDVGKNALLKMQQLFSPTVFAFDLFCCSWLQIKWLTFWDHQQGQCLLLQVFLVSFWLAWHRPNSLWGIGDSHQKASHYRFLQHLMFKKQEEASVVWSLHCMSKQAMNFCTCWQIILFFLEWQPCELEIIFPNCQISTFWQRRFMCLLACTPC